MTYLSAEKTAEISEKAFRFTIELPIPKNGFGSQLAVIHIFHAKLGIAPRRGCCGGRKVDRDYMTWCFADLQHAIAFRILFGGEMNLR
jgi:hypothetical protein